MNMAQLDWVSVTYDDGYQPVTVWVVKFEPLPPNGVGDLDWFYRLCDADACEDELMTTLGGGYKIHRVAMQVPFRTPEKITDFIEASGVLND